MASYDDDLIPDVVNAPAKFINPNKPTPFPFQQRQAAIEARKARLTQLMKMQNAQPEVPEGKMVSGHYVAPAWSQQLAPLANTLAAQYAGGKEQEAIGKEQGEYEQADLQAAMEHAQSAPQGRPEQQGPPLEGGSPELAAQPATAQEKINWAEQGMHIPSRKALLTKLVEDLTIQEPVRAEGRQEKRLTREDTQKAAREALDATLTARREEGARKTEEAEKARVLDEKQSARHDETQRLIAAQASQDRRDRIAAGLDKAAGKPPKPLPASQSKAWIENNTSLGKIDDALDALGTDAGKNAFGLWSATPDVILQRTDPKGVDARAKVADIGSLKIHDRSGASVTAAETPRLKPFIPSVHDKPEVIKTKLDNFKREYEMIQQEIQNYAEDMNYIVPKVRPRTPAAPAGGAPAAAAPTRLSKEQYDKAPSGTVFIAPDGSTRTKP
jgi:hypothetical protein